MRRKIYDVWKATGSTTARTGVSMIDLMYEAEELGRGLPLEDRLDRSQVVRVGVDGFFNWAEDTMHRISGKGALADAIRYAVKRRAALNLLLRGCAAGGRQQPRRELPPARRAAAIYTLIQTARLNFVDPQA